MLERYPEPFLAIYVCDALNMPFNVVFAVDTCAGWELLEYMVNAVEFVLSCVYMVAMRCVGLYFDWRDCRFGKFVQGTGLLLHVLQGIFSRWCGYLFPIFQKSC